MSITTETIEMTSSLKSSNDNENDTRLNEDDSINLKQLDVESKGALETTEIIELTPSSKSSNDNKNDTKLQDGNSIDLKQLDVESKGTVEHDDDLLTSGKLWLRL